MEYNMSYNGQSTVPPSNITFTNLNFITNTVVSTIGNSQVLWVPPAGGDNMVGQYIAAPATPYCCIANIVPSMELLIKHSHLKAGYMD